MLENMEEVVRLANGLITIGIFPFLMEVYRKSRRRFYIFWGVGFFLYGINISIRAAFYLGDAANPNFTSWVAFVFYMSGLILVIAGIGDLIGKTKNVLVSTIIIPFIPFIVYVVSGPALIGWFVTLSPFLLISLSLIFIRRKYAAYLDLFIIGWLLLLFTNIAVPLNMMAPVYLELLAIFGKIIIFFGMIQPRFSLLADDLKRYLISGAPEVYANGNSEHFTLIYPKSNQRTREIKSICEKTNDNSVKGIRTILIMLYDLISPQELKDNGLLEGDIFLVRVMPGGQTSLEAFQNSIMTMRDDMTQFEIFLTDIINFSNERRIQCDVILYTLSWLIHTHGWKRVYSLLISKMPELKASSVRLHCYYYPETHKEKTEISIFEKLADRIVTI